MGHLCRVYITATIGASINRGFIYIYIYMCIYMYIYIHIVPLIESISILLWTLIDTLQNHFCELSFRNEHFTSSIYLLQEISLFGPPKTSKTKNQAGDTLTSLILFAHLWNHVVLWTWSSTHFGPRSDTWRRSGPGRTSQTTWGRTTTNSEHNLTFRDRSSFITLFVSVTDLLSN